jgi:quercetin dioxygenase-like cupin family protein
MAEQENLVERWNTAAEGSLTEAAMRRKLETLGYSVSRYDYPPGTVFSSHTHGVDKIDAVLAGRFRVTLPSGAVVLEAGDLVRVPRGVEHSAEVVGRETVVSLDAVLL